MHPDRFFEMMRLVHDALDDKDITSVSTYHNIASVNEKPIVLVLTLATGRLFVDLQQHGFSTMCFPTYENNNNLEVWVRDF